jgi:hypothetical protein
MAILPKAMYRHNSIPIKVLMTFFTEINKNNPKIHVEAKRDPQIDKAILSKSNVRGIPILNFKLYYKALVTKSALYWHQKRHVDKWNRRSRNKSMLLQPSDS